MTSPHGRLTLLQQEILDAFFSSTSSFVLTGGAALAGFYAQHRETDDLDMFTRDRVAFQATIGTLPAWSELHGFSLVAKVSAPAFHRVVVGRNVDSVVVDFVHDLSPQLGEPPQIIAGIRLDPLQQIFVNKITTLVGRQEERDIVDVMVLERNGLRVEDFLTAAFDKDGGCTPAALAWLLDPWASGLDGVTVLPGGFRGADVKQYMRDLAARMRRAAFPT